MTDLHTIPARSRRAAMDWSLVLASQGIEHTIDSVEDAWALLVSDVDAERANAAIQAYEQENTTVWRQEVKWTGLLFDWRSVFWWMFVGALFFLCEARPAVRDLGAFDSARFLQGEWWRAITAVSLHANGAHLALNAATGLVLLGMAMGFYGAGRGLLLSLLCGAGANACEAFLSSGSYVGLGASGMVMASLGLLAAQSVFESHTSAREWAGRGVIAAALLFALLGLDMNSDVLAHFLGFVNGIVAGIAMCLIDRRFRPRPIADAVAAIIAASLLGGSWAFALRNADILKS
jgi:rhomboid protease GluP